MNVDPLTAPTLEIGSQGMLSVVNAPVFALGIIIEEPGKPRADEQDQTTGPTR